MSSACRHNAFSPTAVYAAGACGYCHLLSQDPPFKTSQTTCAWPTRFTKTHRSLTEECGTARPRISPTRVSLFVGTTPCTGSARRSEWYFVNAVVQQSGSGRDLFLPAVWIEWHCWARTCALGLDGQCCTTPELLKVAGKGTVRSPPNLLSGLSPRWRQRLLRDRNRDRNNIWLWCSRSAGQP